MIYEIPSFLHDFMQCSSMQRLKKIDMNCGMYYTNVPMYQSSTYYSRFDHSVGVACILWKYTHDRKQTLAGLFHDIATPVFSHTIDFMNGDYLKQESTEAYIEKILQEDETLMKQLAAQGISLSDVADYHMYALADNESPRLCADRLEYTLSNGIHYGYLCVEDAEKIYDNIVPLENEFDQMELVFKDSVLAEQFAFTALKCGRVYTSDANRYGMQMLSEIMKEMIEKNVLVFSDLYTDENRVITKIRQSSSEEKWNAFQSLSAVEVVRYHPYESNCYQVDAKKRYIDPYVDRMGRVSAISAVFQQEMQEFVHTSFAYGMKGIWNE